MNCFPRRGGIFILAIIFGMLPLAGNCSTKDKLLHFFFDGVPGPDGKPAPEEGEDSQQEYDPETQHPRKDLQQPSDLGMKQPAPKPMSVHPPYSQGECSRCHESGPQLKVPQPSLCFQCHENFLDRVKFKHTAAESGQCATCHNPHESQNEKLLQHLGRAMCLECHDDPVKIAALNENPPAKELSLVKPAPAAKAPPAEKAKPEGEVAQKNASEASDLPVADPALVAKDIPLITNDIPVPKALANHTAKVVHQPVEGDCSECHDPHGSNNKGNLKKPLVETCFSCHDDFLKTVKFKHDPAGNGECMSCHAPHASDNKGLLLKPDSKMCLDCHDDPATKGKVQHQALDSGCVECHDPHGSNNKGNLKKLLVETCFSCHDDFRKTVKFKHDPVDNGECASCHDPHASDNKGLLLKPDSKMCLECHDDPATKGKVQHQALDSGCTECHSPHGSNIKGGLKKPLTETCFSCHDDFLKTAKFKHDPAGNGECMACHEPHASANNGLLVKPGSKMCFDCHDEAEIKKQKEHLQFPDRDCISCHDPHSANNEKLLKPGAEGENKASSK